MEDAAKDIDFIREINSLIDNCKDALGIENAFEKSDKDYESIPKEVFIVLTK